MGTQWSFWSRHGQILNTTVFVQGNDDGSFCLLSNHLASGVTPEDEDEFMEDMELGPPYDGRKPVKILCLLTPFLLQM